MRKKSLIEQCSNLQTLQQVYSLGVPVLVVIYKYIYNKNKYIYIGYVLMPA